MTTVTPLFAQELPAYFAAQQRFYGMADPEGRAAAILRPFSPVEREELASEFLVMRGGSGEIVAGLGVSDGKFVQGFCATGLGQWGAAAAGTPGAAA
ncbi:hypothetical protein GCM10017783_18560 [Deinococcus piscis]|uniref:Uncharacterized protein n=1 Tax=Deinococcus piscis TaxID=394230 RepID=A0ABQ3KDU6_9DEIO|nr:hypothetical protein [Deinococcus piscis]GHG06219.1 hypothetical protein GCM10017783_18560 [Deinococcus piscis]